MGRGGHKQEGSVVLYGNFRASRRSIAEEATEEPKEKPILFRTSFEGQSHGWDSIDEWLSDQRHFDSERECWEILEEIDRTGSALWAGVLYNVVDRSAFHRAFAAIPEPPE